MGVPDGAVPADRVLRDGEGWPVPCGQEECQYGVPECTSCPDNPHSPASTAGRKDTGFSMAVDAALQQCDRATVLACRLVEEGVFGSYEEAIEWADAENGGGDA